MTIPASIVTLVEPWSTLYGSSQPVSVGVVFLHLAGVMVGGGRAIAADADVLGATVPDPGVVARLGRAHRIVIPALARATGRARLGPRAVCRRGEPDPVAAHAAGRLLAAGGGLRGAMPCSFCLNPDRRRFLLTSAATLATLVPVRATVAEARYPIPAADGASIDNKNQVILVRDGGSVYAFALSCPHENTALRWRARDKRFQCPRHESKYTPDGTFTSGRATRNMDRFPVSRAGDQIAVDLTKVYHSDADLPHWQAAVVTL